MTDFSRGSSSSCLSLYSSTFSTSGFAGFFSAVFVLDVDGAELYKYMYINEVQKHRSIQDTTMEQR